MNAEEAQGGAAAIQVDSNGDSDSDSQPKGLLQGEGALRERVNALVPFLVSLISTSTRPGYESQATDSRYVPTGNIPALPLELLHSIVSLVDLPTLTNLCLVNDVFREVAMARLYRTVHLSRPSTAVKCLKTLSGNLEAAKHVRSLSILFPKKTHIDFTQAFAALLGRALHNTLQLTSLDLHIFGPLGRYLRGSLFRATDVQVACDWDSDFSAWLCEQSAVRVLVFNGLPDHDIPIDPSALPNLNRVMSLPSVISTIVPGRPVQQVLVSCVRRDTLNMWTMEALAQACKSSTGPVRAVHVLYKIYRHPPPEAIFQGLSPIPLHLPELVKFSMQAYTYSVDEHYIECLCNFIGGFRRLESLYVYSEQHTDILHEDDNSLRRLALSFGDHCPTLRAVRFPDVFYAYRAPGEWVSLSDVVQLLERHQETVIQSIGNKVAAVTAKGASSSSPQDPSREVTSASMTEEADINNHAGMLRRIHAMSSASDFDIMSPEYDAIVASLLNFAYRIARAFLERLGARLG